MTQPTSLAMGIKNFHEDTRHYLTNGPVHISKYYGRRIGCDVSAWLHSGAVNHAYELQSNEPTPWEKNNSEPPWVSYSMKMVKMLLAAGVEPVVRCNMSIHRFGLTPLPHLTFISSYFLSLFPPPFSWYSTADVPQQRKSPIRNVVPEKPTPAQRRTSSCRRVAKRMRSTS